SQDARFPVPNVFENSLDDRPGKGQNESGYMPDFMANLIETIPAAPMRKAQPTLYDVCRLSGVSSATASRVFSGNARLTDEIRKRVQVAAVELGYEPSHAARALAGRRTHTLGAIFPEIASGFYADVLAGIDDVA